MSEFRTFHCSFCNRRSIRLEKKAILGPKDESPYEITGGLIHRVDELKCLVAICDKCLKRMKPVYVDKPDVPEVGAHGR